MTDLLKKIRRRSTGRHRGARFVVELLPGDVAGFRRERSREWFYIELSRLLRHGDQAGGRGQEAREGGPACRTTG